MSWASLRSSEEISAVIRSLMSFFSIVKPDFRRCIFSGTGDYFALEILNLVQSELVSSNSIHFPARLISECQYI